MKTAVLAFLLLATTALGSNVQSCHLKFFQDASNTDVFISDGSSTMYETSVPVPRTWTFPNPPNDGSEVTLTSLEAVMVEWYCSEVCKLTVWSAPSFDGMSESYYLAYNDDLVVFPFSAESYSIDCGPYISEEEVEEQEEEEQEEEEQPCEEGEQL